MRLDFVIFVLILLAASLVLSAVDNCTSIDQRNALSLWSSNLDVSAWTNSTGWNESTINNDTDQCYWYGVTCSHGGLVTELNLRSNGLAGLSLGGLASNDTQDSSFITHALGCSLESLTLEGNGLEGPLPDLALLPALKLINVASNQLNGTITPSIGSMKSIEYIDLSVNALSGPVPPSICSDSLISLSLAQNQLTGPLDLSECSNLVLINVDGNALIHGSFIAPKDNNRLQIMQLSKTNISDFTEAFSSPHAVVLNAFLSGLTGTIPPQIENLRSLYSLNLLVDPTGPNSLSGLLPPQLFEIPSLHDVDLSNNFFNGTLPGTEAAASLVTLVIKNNCLSGSIPSSFVRSFTQNSVLDLRMNYMSCCAVGPLQLLNPNKACGGSNVWYNGYNLSAPRLPPGLKFSSILGPVIQPINSLFTSDNEWLPSLGNTSYPGLSCPFILPADMEDNPQNFLNWQIDPEYTLFYGCKCDVGLVTLYPVFNNLTLMQCVAPPPESSPWWVKYYWIFIIIGIVGFAVILLVVWLASRGYRSTVVKMFLDAQRRAKGPPTSGKISIVLTDVEGFSRLMRASPDLTMQAMLAHNNIIQKAKFNNYGFNLEQEGDSFSLLFEKASDAVSFCLQSQQMLAAHKWPKGLFDGPLPRPSMVNVPNPEGSYAMFSMHSEFSRSKSIVQKATSVIGNMLRFKSRHEAVLEDEGEGEGEETVEPSPTLDVFRGPPSLLGQSIKKHASLHLVAVATSSRNSPASDDQNVDPRIRTSKAHSQDSSSQIVVQSSDRDTGKESKDSPNDSTESKDTKASGTNKHVGRRSPESKKKKNVVKGLKVRMGVATGYLTPGSTPENSSIMETARAVGEAGAGGQVLMCSQTFQEVKELTEVLGRVTEEGLDFEEDGRKGGFWSWFKCGSGTQRDNDAVILDMGEYLFYPKGARVPLLFKAKDFTHDADLNSMDKARSEASPEDAWNEMSRSGRRKSQDEVRESPEVAKRAGSHNSLGGRGPGPSPNPLLPKKGNALRSNASRTQLRVYQILSPSLLNRGRYFGTKVALKEEWIRVESPYFSAPGVLYSSLGPKDKLPAGTLLPSIASVFISVEGSKVFASKNRQDAYELDLSASALIKSLLRIIPGGFFAKHLGGELKYVLSFDTAEAALYWSIVFQSMALYWEWPSSPLQHWPEVVESRSGELLFRGPRFKIGVSLGVPQSILPDYAGKPDYLGASINSAARFGDAAAHGGQVVCEEQVALKALDSWARAAFSFFELSRDPSIQSVNLLPMPPPSSSAQKLVHQDSSTILAPESYDIESVTNDVHAPSSASLGGASNRVKHASFAVKRPALPAQEKETGLEEIRVSDAPQPSAENSLRLSPFAMPGQQGLVAASGSSFTRGSQPLKSAMRQPGIASTSGAGLVSARQSSFTSPSSMGVARAGGSFTMTRMDPGQLGPSMKRRSAIGADPEEEAQEMDIQRLRSVGNSIRTMSGLGPRSASALGHNPQGKEWNMPSRSLLTTNKMIIVAQRLGTFTFEGSPDPLSMVDLTTSDLLPRRYPMIAPKGKGSRLAAGWGEVGRTHVPELGVQGHLKVAWREAKLIRIGPSDGGNTNPLSEMKKREEPPV